MIAPVSYRKAPSSNSPSVSVVTPFYNTASLLRECIESVLAQDYEDFEYLLVDNRSTDGGGEIAAEYAKRDPRVRIVTQPTHLSQIDNYNSSLQSISPSTLYCKFVQADDWIFPSCLREMVSLAAANPNMGLVSAFGVEGGHIAQSGLEWGQMVWSGRDICRRVIRDGLMVFGSPTSVLFRADLVRDRVPFYRPASPFEDVETCFELLRNSEFGFVFQVLSFNRREPDSTWNRIAPFGPLVLMRFLTAVRYAPDYFDRDEVGSIIELASWRYYDFLAKARLQGVSKEFWAFHSSVLAAQGLGIDKPQLRRHVVRRLLAPIRALAREFGALFVAGP